MVTTKRLQLRQLKLDDVHLLHLLNNDEGVIKYLDHQAPPLELVQKQARETINKYINSPQLGMWIAETVSEGKFIGWFALTHCGPDAEKAMELDKHPDTNRVLEIGYRLRPDFWGKGLATEGCRALVQSAFSLTEAEELVGTTMFVNWASRRIMEKIGMKHRSTFQVEFENPLPGTEFGEVLYGISRKEWSEAESKN